MVKVVYILSDFFFFFCFPLYLDLMARIDAFVNICLWDPNLSHEYVLGWESWGLWAKGPLVLQLYMGYCLRRRKNTFINSFIVWGQYVFITQLLFTKTEVTDDTTYHSQPLASFQDFLQVGLRHSLTLKTQIHPEARLVWKWEAGKW